MVAEIQLPRGAIVFNKTDTALHLMERLAQPDRATLAKALQKALHEAAQQAVQQALTSRQIKLDAEGGRRIVREPEVRKISGFSKTQLKREIAREAFPAPVKISERCVGWDSRAVEAWLEAKFGGDAR